MPLGPAEITAVKPVIAYIGLGANLGDPRAQVEEAVRRLREADEVEILRMSAFYLTPPLGPLGQPWYVNAAVQVKTRLTPEELMRVLIGIETAMGRMRGERWGPRLIDLDVLLYNGEIITGPDLTVPHPEMHRRAFVLAPLVEIAPKALHPLLRKSVQEMWQEMDAGEREAVKKI